MRSKFKPAKLITAVTILITFLFVFTTVVYAIGQSRSNVLPEQASPSSQKKDKGRGKGDLKDRLDEVKLKVCEKKEASIQKRSTRLVAKAENIQSRFNRITQKVDDFYVDKLVPAGLEINNYEQILNNLVNKRIDVDSALGVAKGTADNFTCEGQSPKDQVKQFRADMKSVVTALQDYKKAIINYLVTVRTKAKNYKAETATSSAEPATGSAEPTESAGTE